MPRRCPLCHQTLPAGINEHQLHARIEKLTSPAHLEETRKLRKEFAAQLVEEREIARKRAERQCQNELREAQGRAQRAQQEKDRESKRLRQEYSERLARETKAAKSEAAREMKKQLTDAENRAEKAERRRELEVERARRETSAQWKKQTEDAVRLANRENEAKLTASQADREREKARHAVESARMQGELDKLSRKLEKQSSEQLGDEGELDLYTELRREFPSDKIDRIRRGKKGADIVQQVMDGTTVAGQIVYESKNTLEWSKGFITQAKKYQTQYETPHVMVVTRAFPSKIKGLCVLKGIPVVGPRLAVSLGTIIREGIVEIARLRLSAKFRDQKSQELFDYIIGDKFCTRFREIAEGVSSLREHQQEERRSHEKTWAAEAKIHERIENRHREVDAQIRAIVGRRSNGRLAKFVAKSERLRDFQSAVN